MLKIKTIAMIVVVIGIASAAWATGAYDGDGYMMLKASELEWKPIGSMPPGAQMAVVEGDLSEQAPFTFRLKLPADYQLAPHIHPAYERVTVLSGELHFAHGEAFDKDKTSALEPGDMAIMAPGEPMFGYTEEETMIQLHGTGPWGITYLNPEDDPRN